MNKLYLSIAEVLIDIERELRQLQLWEFEMISEAALASTEPFAIDTMTFPQWLQFVFLPRLYFMLEAQLELPTNCSVAPMAEEYFSVLNVHSAPLLVHLRSIDGLLTRRDS